MIGVNSKLYDIMTLITEIIIISAICFLLAIPLVTLPLATLLYCQVCGNIVSERKFFHIPVRSRKKLMQGGFYLFVGLCSLYSSLSLIQMEDFFLSRLLVSIVISFNVTAGILILEQDMNFLGIYRKAFFYSIGFFHKSILPVFVYLLVLSRINGRFPRYGVLLVTIFYSYFVFKLNYKTIGKLVFKWIRNDL